MKKFFFNIAILIGMCLTFNSCATTVQAQVEDDVYGANSSVEASVIMTEGTPAYDVSGYIVYYFYDGWYYYPYIYNNRYHFRRYITPVNTYYIRGWHRPIPRSHFDIPHRRIDRPITQRHRPNINHRPKVNNRPNVNHRPSVNFQHRPNGGMNRGGNFNRPSSPQRSSTRSGGGYFGGRR